MYLKKNKFNQFFFLILIFFGSIFNGSNSNDLVLINFIVFFIFFLKLLTIKNNITLAKHIFNKNYKLIYLFLILLFYVFLQTIPMPISWLKFFSITYYDYLSNLNLKNFYSISLDSKKSFIEAINYINIFLIIFITQILFYKKKHYIRFIFFVVFIGFLHAFSSIFILLLGNPEFFLEKIVHYKSSATGFYINRSNFSFFLMMTFICGIQYIFIQYLKPFIRTPNKINFDLIYIRIFLIFITIAIISSLSRLGNFYLILCLSIYLLFSFKYFKKLFNQFTLIFLIFILFDFFILGIYFGGLDLFDRFLFLNEELNINSFLSTETNVVDIKNSYVPINRFEIISISINFFKKFIFFGYGAGSFEKTFILFYEDLTLFYANHAHSDFIELMGEFGIVGLLIISLIFISLAKTTLNSFLDDDNYFKIMTLTLTLIFFINGFVDFSLNIPSNQYLFASLFSISLKKKSKVY
jgi:hypothetical protein